MSSSSTSVSEFSLNVTFVSHFHEVYLALPHTLTSSFDEDDSKVVGPRGPDCLSAGYSMLSITTIGGELKKKKPKK